MGDMKVITAADRNVLLRADSGAIRFKVKIPLPGLGPALSLSSKDKPLVKAYRIVIGRQTKVINYTSVDQEVKVFALNNLDFQHYQEFWITLYNKNIRMGVLEEPKPFLVYPLNTDFEVGYLQFNTINGNWAPVEWIVETAPLALRLRPFKRFEDKVRWGTISNGQLPVNAMIGGFESEPTYIARAYHNNSLCPGKYVPSAKLAYVPWGHREHSKREFEVLVGYNLKWVKTKLNYIPTNALIAGRSEVQNEPLYIGRAMYDGKLLTGKVHTLYKTCFLPYNGKEIEVTAYEILVVAEDEIKQAIPFDI